MITLAVSVVGVVAMMFTLATSDDVFRAALVAQVKSSFRNSYAAHHRANGTGAPYWKEVTQ